MLTTLQKKNLAYKGSIENLKIHKYWANPYLSIEGIWSIRAMWLDKKGRRNICFPAVCSTMGRAEKDAKEIARLLNKAHRKT